MDISSTLALTAMIFAAAWLYASVGHAGASGYLAAMALFGLAPAVMKPTALTLNVLVASIATVKFYRAGCFSARLFWPLALAAVPMAYLGGYLQLPAHHYRPLVGVVLLYAAWRMLRRPTEQGRMAERLPAPAVVLSGAGIGFLSGLTGVGGGIFLSPLLLLAGWATPRLASGVAAPFILLNSLAGLLGLMGRQAPLPEQIPFWAMAAIAGGWLGAEYGSRRLASRTILRLLAVVLAVAGLKMLLSQGG